MDFKPENKRVNILFTLVDGKIVTFPNVLYKDEKAVNQNWLKGRPYLNLEQTEAGYALSNYLGSEVDLGNSLIKFATNNNWSGMAEVNKSGKEPVDYPIHRQVAQTAQARGGKEYITLFLTGSGKWILNKSMGLFKNLPHHRISSMEILAIPEVG